jgi:predicted dienelactone hydrolase
MHRILIACLTTIMLTAANAPVQAQVGLQSRDWIDDTRPNLLQSEGGRPLDARIWYPAAPASLERAIAMGEDGAEIFIFGHAAPGADPVAGSYPLIVLSHGNGGSALQLMWLAEVLADSGYLVAAVNHHGNTAVEPELVEMAFATPWERAIDLSRLIDALLADPVFGPMIDAESIGVGGFSIGGYSALVAAGGRPDYDAYDAFCASALRDGTCGPQLENPDQVGAFERLQGDSVFEASRARLEAFEGDARVKASFLIAPALGAAFEADDLVGVQGPIALTAGDADQIAPAATNAAYIAQRHRDAALTLIEGGVGHYAFLGQCGPAGPRILPDLCMDAEGVDRAAVHQQAAALAVRHFDTAFGRSAGALRHGEE